jgi:uncharacterized protein (TIGR02594 family)
MFHKVEKGETLSSISAWYGVPVDVLIETNPPMNRESPLVAGQILFIPADDGYRRPFFGGGNRPTQGRPVNFWYSGANSYNVISISAKRALEAGLANAVPKDKHHGAPWMKTAIGEIGVAEVAGSTRANPKILEYFKASKYWGTDDSGAKNAWCGSFAAWVFQKHGYTPVSKAFRAREWKNFGKSIGEPLYGALGIKSRTGGGHVSFVVGKNKAGDKLFMLGGNQDDKVQVSEYPRDVWETFVVPTNFDIMKGELPVFENAAAACGKES